ncbi:MAG: hypothetical protein L0Z48_02065, partial [candidate division Zixibacteria bacterium]|nr:hypothetical protein [candidate division Zixibacteria bacterium]
MQRCRNVFRTTILLLAVLTLGLTAASFAAVTVDFRQSANNETNGAIQGLGNVHWINSIVQSSNSRYFEGMDNFQRTIITDIPATTGDIHTLSISHQFTKGGIHAYDFLVSWAQAEADDEAALGAPGPPIVMSLNECGDELGPPNTLPATCTALRGGGNFIDVVVPDDPYLSKDGLTSSRIAAYEAIRGNRTIRIYGNAPISAGSLTICHDVAAGADNGDSYAHYVLQWTSTSTQILVEMAGHLAVSDDGTALSWGAGLGSGQINGGPYHFKLGQIGGAVLSAASCPSTLTEVVSLGSQDNQIKGADILVPCPTCDVSGPVGPFCPGAADQTYSVTVNGVCQDQSTITWSLSNNTSGASFVGGNTGSSVIVNPGSACGGFRLTSSFTCSNCPAPVTCFLDVSVVDNTAPV